MFKPSHLLKARVVAAFLHLLVIVSLLLPAVPVSAQEPPVGQPTGEVLIDLLFPPRIVTTPAVPPWNFPEFTGNPELRPLPDAFDIVERPAWFDGVPATIRPFPSPSVGTGGPDDDHADMWVFFYADGTPVPQLPLLEAVPFDSAVEAGVELGALLFSANWEIHIVRVVQDYVPGTIQSIGNVQNPRWVLEDLQTNMFLTFPIIPQNSTIPGLELNNLNVEAGIFEGSTVFFVEYEIEDEEFSEKPLYLFRTPSGVFRGGAVLSGIPGMPHINSLWEVFIVEVPEDYMADAIKSEAEVLQRLSSGEFSVVDSLEVFAPVETVNNIRTRFATLEGVITGPDGKFHKNLFPREMPTVPQDYAALFPNIPMGFTSVFNFNEVEIPRFISVGGHEDVDALLLQALGEPLGAGQFILPPNIARQLLLNPDDLSSESALNHLEQATLDTMTLEEIVVRGQALFEREIFEHDGTGPAFNAYSCATCHGQPAFLGVEPTAGGHGKGFRDAFQPTDAPGVRARRNTPHLFGAGVIEQLARERGIDGSDDKPPPFRWKGFTPDLRQFAIEASEGESGLQSIERVMQITGADITDAAILDPDGDGKVSELTVGDITAIAAFMANLPRPFQLKPADPEVTRGRLIFDQIGCTSCHTPVMRLNSTTLEIPNPETGGVVSLPLGDPDVELFSDLKRHSMGELITDLAPQSGMAPDVYRTPALWGVGDSAPYLFDGSASTLDEAIRRLGGEGSEAKPAADRYKALSQIDRDALLAFLNNLVLPRRNQLELDFVQRLSNADRQLLAPFIESFTRIITEKPLLVDWMVNPPPEGTGSISGNFIVQASLTSEVGVATADLLVGRDLRLPLIYNPDTGFHEAAVDTTTLEEGDHLLRLDVRDVAGQRSNNTSVFIHIDNIPDPHPVTAIPQFSLSDIPPERIKTFDVSAIDVDIQLNRFGDHDPLGMMYVLDVDEVGNDNIAKVRANEALPWQDRVSTGLRTDIIQPLVLRANVGDVVIINFTNRLGLGRAGMTVHGLPMDPVRDSGYYVGLNDTNDTLVGPGQSTSYTWVIPDQPNMEGSYVFNSMGSPRRQQTHGLFGVLNVEPKGSTYISPVTGQEIMSGWEAIIIDPGGKDFREDTIIYHEIGNEDEAIFDKKGGEIPETDPFNEDAYRPGSRAINYRSEPFFRRQELIDDTIGFVDLSQNYGSYMFGDPATPTPRGYLGDPTKRRIVHAGSERFHAEHLHGGSIRWQMDPFMEPDRWGLPPDKEPPPQSLGQFIDSQIIGPLETYTAATEGAAGGLQGSPGDFLFHCHFPHHYTAGMWAFWRVFDTLQLGLPNQVDPNNPLMELLDRAGETPAPVESTGLIGITMPSGRTLEDVPTNNEILNIDEWLRTKLPPQGVPGVYDASVWDWVRQDTPEGPLYLGEPESAVNIGASLGLPFGTGEWQNYKSPLPGERLPILFNPVNGRPAYPLLRPHLGKRPPFAPMRSGSPWLGDPAEGFPEEHLNTLVPAGARRLEYVIVTTPAEITFNEEYGIVNPGGALPVLDEDKEDILNGLKPKEQLTFRANVGDGVDVIHYSEMADGFFEVSKSNLHFHFLQFDEQASDGVITGMAYEQSVRSYLNEGPTATGIILTQPAQIGSKVIIVDNASTLQVNAYIGIGFGATRTQSGGFEWAQIIGKQGNILTLDRQLQKTHPGGQFVGTEFVRQQFYADVEFGTTFFHNHIFAVPGFGLALTGALVVEPRDSVWLNPTSGDPIRSGAIADILTNHQIAPGIPIQAFREFVLHAMNSITGLEDIGGPGGSEKEPGGFNMKMEPIPNRLADNPDPSLVFSSYTHGDPETPLLRAYAGDLTVIRLLNSSGHDVGAFRLTGHRFRTQRFDPAETVKDSVAFAISERFDLFFTAGSAGLQAGDYIYMNSMGEKLMDGAWGILRVHDTLQPDLQPIRASQFPEGGGLPVQTGGRPPAAIEPETIAELKAKLEARQLEGDPFTLSYQLPEDMPVRIFDVVAIDIPIQFAPVDEGLPDEPGEGFNFRIDNGRMYVLAEDEAAVRNGTKPLEPLVLRANVGEIVRVNFTNKLAASRASFHIPQLIKSIDSLGGAFGFNNDSTVAPNETQISWFVIDPRFEMPRSFSISDFGDPVAGMASGLYGAFIVSPAGSSFHDPVTGEEVKSGAAVDVRNPLLPHGGYRDIALIFHNDDHVMNRDIMPYRVDIRGLRGINYKAEPFVKRLNENVDISQIFRTGAGHTDPLTPIIQATARDPVRLHVLGGYGHHMHVFTIDGHRFPFEPSRSETMNLPARHFAPMMSLDIILEHGAGGFLGAPGDYLYRDGRNPFLEGGLWGIMRVKPKSEATLLPMVPDLVPGWNLVSRHLIPDSTSVQEFLSSIAGKFDTVMAVDPADPENLLSFQAGAADNTLVELNHTIGFWIHMSEGAFLTPTGILPGITEIPLQAGWNLIGWPTFRTMSVIEALDSINGKFDLVYGFEATDDQNPWRLFDPAVPAFASDLAHMRPLLGYWVHMTEPGVLRVENP